MYVLSRGVACNWYICISEKTNTLIKWKKKNTQICLHFNAFITCTALLSAKSYVYSDKSMYTFMQVIDLRDVEAIMHSREYWSVVDPGFLRCLPLAYTSRRPSLILFVGISTRFSGIWYSSILSDRFSFWCLLGDAPPRVIAFIIYLFLFFFFLFFDRELFSLWIVCCMFFLWVWEVEFESSGVRVLFFALCVFLFLVSIVYYILPIDYIAPFFLLCYPTACLSLAIIYRLRNGLRSY